MESNPLSRSRLASISVVPDIPQSDTGGRLRTAQDAFDRLLIAHLSLEDPQVGDSELRFALEQAAQHPGPRLDLSKREMREPLLKLPTELMSALAAVHDAAGVPIEHLVLPDQMPAFPPCFHAFTSLRGLELRDFRGGEIDASRMPRLQMLDLDRVQKRSRIAICVPEGCKLRAVLSDGAPVRTWTWPAYMGRKTYRIEPRNLNWNGRTRFAENNNPIVCRHLAMQMLVIWAQEDIQNVPPEDGVSALEGFDSADQFAAQISFATEQSYEDLWTRGAVSHLVAHGQWTSFLLSQAEAMRLSGKTRQYWLMDSPSPRMDDIGHAMAMRIRIDEKTDECSLDFFDTNFPERVTSVPIRRPPRSDYVQQAAENAARRAAAYAEEGLGDADEHKQLLLRKPPANHDFRQLFGKFLHKVAFDEYFGRTDSPEHVATVRLTLVTDPLDIESSLAAKPSKRTLSKEFADLDTNWQPAVVQNLFAFGDRDGVERLNTYLKTAELSSQRCEELFWCGNFPATHLAAKYGHAHVFPALCECLKTARSRGLLDSKQITSLLAGMAEGASHAIVAAARRGHLSVVKAYAELLGALHACKPSILDQAQIRKILRAEQGGRSTVFLIEDKKMLKAYGKIVSSLTKKGALGPQAAEGLIEIVKDAIADLKP